MPRRPLLIAILGALGCEARQTELCAEVEASLSTCPPVDALRDDLYEVGTCDDYGILSLEEEGVRRDLITDASAPEAQPYCCYEATVYDTSPTSDCVVGRPYDGGRVASLLSAPPADARAAAWVRAGLGEHASVAAFARLTLELMAHGAPLDLLRDAQAAGLDEVRHTELCLARARVHGASVVPGPFPLGEGVRAERSLAHIAADALREGCLAETVAAHMVAVAAERAPDPEVRDVLAAIAADEGRHAVLSWRIVAWALAQGGSEVRVAIEAALAERAPLPDAHELALRAGVPVEVLHAAAEEALVRIVRPAAHALLGGAC